jgi:hypothetical protein
MSMIQPLSGDNSVLGICLISGGDSMSILTTSGYVSSREIRRQNRNPLSTPRTGKQIPGLWGPDLDQVFPVIGAQAERFVLQVVQGPNHPHRLAFCPHQNRVGNCGGGL